MWYLVYIYIFLCSLILSFLLTPLARKIAKTFNLLDYPSERKAHSYPIPLLGGLAIWLSLILTIGLNLLAFFFLRFLNILPSEFQKVIPGVIKILPRLVIILFGASLMILIGLWDDFKKPSALVKLSLQSLVAIMVVLSGIRIQLFLPHPFLQGIITILWLLAITNAFNLLDNMDGLTTGVALIASAIFFIICLQANQLFVSTILAAFIGALLGFLIYNFHPASIFLGDSGSLFIGYTLGVLTVMPTYYTKLLPTPLPVIMPLLILGVPLFDTISVMYIRLKNKKPLFVGDTNHLSHRLVKLGMTQKQAVLFIYLFCLCLGLGALLLRNLNFLGGMTVLLQAIVVITIVHFLERTSNSKNLHKI